MKNIEQRINDSIYGFIVGDALGVPVEFLPREVLKKYPVTNMMENKKRNTTIGYYSDDTAMMLCSMVSILDHEDIVYHDLLEKFLLWFKTGYMGVDNKCFGIGQHTYKSISKYRRLGYPACVIEQDKTKNSSGNGSLMRILPIVYFLYFRSQQTLDNKYLVIEEASRVTHSSIDCLQSCVFFGMFMFNLLDSLGMHEAYEEAIKQHTLYYGPLQSEHLSRILQGGLVDVEKSKIQSTGYVVSTL